VNNNDKAEKVYGIGPWAKCYKTFYVCNLQMFAIS